MFSRTYFRAKIKHSAIGFGQSLCDSRRMKIFPKCELLTLAACQPGQLVRDLESGEAGCFALVSDVEESENRALILLGEDGPNYTVINTPENYNVLAYHGEAICEIDQQGPFDPPAMALFNKNGCVIYSKDSLTMNVSSYVSPVRRDRGSYDLKSFCLVKPRNRISDIAVFGAWNLFLLDEENSGEERLDIYKFLCKADS